MMFRYQERMGISHNEVSRTPWAEIERAFYIWSLDKERAEIEEKRNSPL